MKNKKSAKIKTNNAGRSLSSLASAPALSCATCCYQENKKKLESPCYQVFGNTELGCKRAQSTKYCYWLPSVEDKK